MKSAQATCAGAQLQSGAAAARYSFQRRALRISHNSHKHISIPARAKARHLTMAFAHPLTTKLEGKSWSDVRDLLRSPELEGQVRYRQSELHPDLYCLTYEQISADWKNPFTSECRDWSTAVFTEKLDGSLMKVYYLESEAAWMVATNNIIDARETTGAYTAGNSFHTLFEEAAACTLSGSAETLQQPRAEWPDFPYQLLDKRYTYLFELCHPMTRVVVQHDMPKLTHLATRWTLMYEDAALTQPISDTASFTYPHVHATVPGIPAVLQIPIQNVEACQKLLASGEWANPVRHEGIVATDAHFNRVKIKSPAYVGIAYALSQKTTGVRGLIVYIQNVILKGEIDEVVATMPELAPKLRVLQKVYDAFVAELVTTANQLQQDFAMEEGKARKGKWAKACQGLPKYMFNTLFRCHTETEPLDHAKLKGLLYDQYETMPSKIVGDMILQQLVPQYATEEEARVLTSADQGFDLQDEA